MFFSSDVETYNIVVWIMASYDGSDTEKIYHHVLIFFAGKGSRGQGQPTGIQ